MAFLKNTAKESFGNVAGSAAVPVTHYEAIFGTSSLEVTTGRIAFNTPRNFAQGDPIEIPIGDLSIQLPGNDFPNAFAKAFTDDMLQRRGNPQVKLYNNASELSDAGYSAQTVEMASTLA